MRVRVAGGSIKLWASANDTYAWAHKSGAVWPCSQLSGRRLFVEFDDNGLCELAIDGKDDVDVDGNELSACAADLLESSGKVPADHPARFVAIDRFLTV